MKQIMLLVGYMLSFLSIKALPVENGKVNFDEGQMTKLKTVMSDADIEKLVNSFNEELAKDPNFAKQQNELDEISTKLNAALAKLASESNAADPDTGKTSENLDVTLSQKVEKLTNLQNQKLDQMNNTIEKLIGEAEGDSPLAIIYNSMKDKKVEHSATHLFASGKTYDAFADRNWNQRALGTSMSATDFSDSIVVNKLNGDLSLFYRENPQTIESLIRDNYGLPAHWKKQMGVDSEITRATISTAEVTQARKLNWLPKNKQLIEPESGRIYPTQIDLEWIGYDLQKMEDSWLNFLNKEGTQPYKMSFVNFLVSEIMKQARIEDRISAIKGVYVKTPETATTPASFINRQNGILYQFWKARDIDKKYRPFNIGAPTVPGIVDYVDTFIKSLPFEVRNMQGLELVLSPTWLRAYKNQYEKEFGGNNNYTGYPTNPKDFSNIEFTPLVDIEGSNFMWISFKTNPTILENQISEKTLLRFQLDTRNIKVFGDYKTGIMLDHIGHKIEAGDPDEYKVQSVWSNNVPIFGSNDFAPLYAGGIIDITFNQLKVVPAHAIDITTIAGLVAGQVLKIMGDTTATSKVKHNVSKINLAGAADFNLATGGTLTLYLQSTGVWKELSRTTAPETIDNKQYFDDATVDATLGNDFYFNGKTTTAITGIENGVENQEITIYGTATAPVKVTLSTTGNIRVTAAATLSGASKYIKLIKVGATWYETVRNV